MHNYCSVCGDCDVHGLAETAHLVVGPEREDRQDESVGVQVDEWAAVRRRRRPVFGVLDRAEHALTGEVLVHGQLAARWHDFGRIAVEKRRYKGIEQLHS